MLKSLRLGRGLSAAPFVSMLGLQDHLRKWQLLLAAHRGAPGQLHIAGSHGLYSVRMLQELKVRIKKIPYRSQSYQTPR